MRNWTPQETRDAVVDFVKGYSTKTDLPRKRLINSIGISRDRFYDWCRRFGQENQHNAMTPRDFWIEEWERREIVKYFHVHKEEGHRRLTYMMCDADIVSVSPSTTYRVLKKAGLLDIRKAVISKKGTGFKQPSDPHQHWHIDVSYININGTFYYFCGLLDGYSRYLIHWEIREAMKESDIEIIIQRAKEKCSRATPRIISDNGPQFIAREFKEFIRMNGMTHVRTSPYYPQSNGKIERFHQSLKRECIRPKTPVSLEDARSVVGRYVDHYNNERLHSAIGYIVPRDQLEGRAPAIHSGRRRKMQEARQRRKENAHGISIVPLSRILTTVAI